MGWFGDLRACRFCRRVTGFIFLAILVVEGILLIPSYLNYERDRLMQLDDVGMTAVTGLLLAYGDTMTTDKLDAVAPRWMTETPLVGLRLIGPAGDISVGEPVERVPGTVLTGRPGRIADGSRYEASWTVAVSGQVWQVAARLDARPVGTALFWFVWRIIGLVGVIAIVVTTATMVVLTRSLIGPLLRLRDQMLLAADAPADAVANTIEATRTDEIGDMARTFNMMTRRIAVSIEDLKTREAELATARDAAEQANLAKSAFLAAMSHELRTPLNAVIGFSDIMRRESFGPHTVPRYKDYAEDVHSAGSHLLGLINDILDLSKAEAGRIEIEESEFSLFDLVDGSMRLVGGRAESGGIALNIQTPPNLIVRGDAQRLRQVLLNLASNAIKFTPSGGRVDVQVGRTATDDLLITVADSGSGIAAADLETVFEPFVQVGDRMLRREGTGLGLPISRRLAEAHGGRLTLTSQLGSGTTAMLVLPASRVRVLNASRTG